VQYPTDPRLDVAVRATDLVKVYGTGDAAVRALDGVSVEFPRHAFTAIMGPSGSGKSTLMHCLAGLDAATSGTVMLGDADITTLGDAGLTRVRRERVGFVFQSFNLLPQLSAEENILLPLSLGGRRPDPALFDRWCAGSWWATRPCGGTPTPSSPPSSRPTCW
jgi:putative ABC transport system ATP-binding protein